MRHYDLALSWKWKKWKIAGSPGGSYFFLRYRMQKFQLLKSCFLVLKKVDVFEPAAFLAGLGQAPPFLVFIEPCARPDQRWQIVRYDNKKRVPAFAETLIGIASGWQDSNLRPSAPKAANIWIHMVLFWLNIAIFPIKVLKPQLRSLIVDIPLQKDAEFLKASFTGFL